jgi:DNA-binding NtrC family response regulator
MSGTHSIGPPNSTSYDAQHVRWASPLMRALDDDVTCATRSDARVMISGERGTGKKSLARLIHQRSRRAPARFAVAGCNELAMLTTAGNGTLVIDDIEKMPSLAQGELMQFIERGNGRGRDLRLMTTAGRGLWERVQSNQFRDDLFYRLNVVHLTVPPLRDRPEDIPILFQHYLSLYATTAVPGLSAGALRQLVDYAWPGNIPELQAAARTLAARSLSRTVEAADLPPDFPVQS